MNIHNFFFTKKTLDDVLSGVNMLVFCPYVLVCTRMLLVCFSYVVVCIRMLLVCFSYVLVCTRMLLVCYSYVLVCTRMLLVCTRMYSCGVLVTIVINTVLQIELALVHAIDLTHKDVMW